MMLKNIKNRVQAIKLIFYIMDKRQTVEVDNIYSLEYIIEKWNKKRELGTEIFRDPRILINKLAGDCDDQVTLLANLTKEKDISLLYPIKNNGIYHIAFILKGKIYDSWISKKPISFTKENLRKYYTTKDFKLIKINDDDKRIREVNINL